MYLEKYCRMSVHITKFQLFLKSFASYSRWNEKDSRNLLKEFDYHFSLIKFIHLARIFILFPFYSNFSLKFSSFIVNFSSYLVFDPKIIIIFMIFINENTTNLCFIQFSLMKISWINTTSFFMAIVMFSIHLTICEIFTFEMCMTQ